MSLLSIPCSHLVYVVRRPVDETKIVEIMRPHEVRSLGIFGPAEEPVLIFQYLDYGPLPVMVLTVPEMCLLDCELYEHTKEVLEYVGRQIPEHMPIYPFIMLHSENWRDVTCLNEFVNKHWPKIGMWVTGNTDIPEKHGDVNGS
jgi:hypothetical protein